MAYICTGCLRKTLFKDSLRIDASGDNSVGQGCWVINKYELNTTRNLLAFACVQKCALSSMRYQKGGCTVHNGGARK